MASIERFHFSWLSFPIDSDWAQTPTKNQIPPIINADHHNDFCHCIIAEKYLNMSNIELIVATHAATFPSNRLIYCQFAIYIIAFNENDVAFYFWHCFDRFSILILNNRVKRLPQHSNAESNPSNIWWPFDVFSSFESQ